MFSTNSKKAEMTQQDTFGDKSSVTVAQLEEVSALLRANLANKTNSINKLPSDYSTSDEFVNPNKFDTTLSPDRGDGSKFLTYAKRCKDLKYGKLKKFQKQVDEFSQCIPMPVMIERVRQLEPKLRYFYNMLMQASWDQNGDTKISNSKLAIVWTAEYNKRYPDRKKESPFSTRTIIRMIKKLESVGLVKAIRVIIRKPHIENYAKGTVGNQIYTDRIMRVSMVYGVKQYYQLTDLGFKNDFRCKDVRFLNEKRAIIPFRQRINKPCRIYSTQNQRWEWKQPFLDKTDPIAWRQVLIDKNIVLPDFFDVWHIEQFYRTDRIELDHPDVILAKLKYGKGIKARKSATIRAQNGEGKHMEVNGEEISWVEGPETFKQKQERVLASYNIILSHFSGQAAAA